MLKTPWPYLVGWKILNTSFLATVIAPLVSPDRQGYLRDPDPLKSFRIWDAAHYLRMAGDGYRDRHEAVFYPLYPALIRIVAGISPDPLFAGLFLAVVLPGAFAWIYYRFVREFGPKTCATPALLLMAAFPCAFYLNLIYAEALFLLLLFQFLYDFLLRDSYRACATGFLLPLARGQGVFVGIAVAILAGCEARAIVINRNWRRLGYLLSVCCAFLAGGLTLFAYDALVFGDPFAFITGQGEHHYADFGHSFANTLRPNHVLDVLFTFTPDFFAQRYGGFHKIFIWLGFAFLPLVWRLDRRLFLVYVCLFYFPATMGFGGSYARYFLVPYSIVAIAIARLYISDGNVPYLGIRHRHLILGCGLIGFAAQCFLSLAFAAHRFIG